MLIKSLLMTQNLDIKEHQGNPKYNRKNGYVLSQLVSLYKLFTFKILL